MTRLLAIFVLASAAMAQVRPAPSAPPGKGSIEGVVSDPDQEPIRKVQVTLAGTIENPLTAVTDAGGRFAFRGLRAGAYWVTASKPGYNPSPGIFGDQAAAVTLVDGEEKKDVKLALAPGAAISGRIVNEDGAPVRGCNVMAVQPGYEQNQRTLRSIAGGMGSNDRGEYRLTNLSPGRYTVFAHCLMELRTAQPLLPRGDPRTPHATYFPQFYGGGLNPDAATRLTVTAGASMENVDFRMTRVPSFTLRGAITGDPEALAGNLNVMLLPANSLIRNLLLLSAGVNSQTHKFEIQPVIPGSYLLLVFSSGEGHAFSAQRAVEVGPAPPDPLEIPLSSGAQLKGSLQFDSDNHPPIEGIQISLAPLEGPIFMPQPQAQPDKDGTFTLTGVLPGRWRLVVSAPGYPKSVSLGGQAVSAYGFEVGSGSGPLRITMAGKMADVRVSVAGALPGQQVFALLFPEDRARRGSGLERSGGALGTGQIGFGLVPPGRYRAFATDIRNPWALLEQPDLLQALESHTTVIDVPDEGAVICTVESIPRDELVRVIEAQL